MQPNRFRCANVFVGLLIASCTCSSICRRGYAQESGRSKGSNDVESQRMHLMRARALSIDILSESKGFPKKLQGEPLFRYDDLPRGYVDGAVWRLGAKGRPLAIITTELHPNYSGGGPRIVYDLLSLSPKPFSAKSADVPGWTPSESAVTMKPLEGDKPAATAAQRLFQMKRMIQRFTANQVVSEEDPETIKLNLRQLPRPIDRYAPEPSDPSTKAEESDRADGAVFLFVAGRMPGVIVFIDTDGSNWRYGIGRLSAPSTLVVKIDDVRVWTVPPNTGGWSDAYCATNAEASIPGF